MPDQSCADEAKVIDEQDLSVTDDNEQEEQVSVPKQNKATPKQDELQRKSCFLQKDVYEL